MTHLDSVAVAQTSCKTTDKSLAGAGHPGPGESPHHVHRHPAGWPGGVLSQSTGFGMCCGPAVIPAACPAGF